MTASKSTTSTRRLTSRGAARRDQIVETATELFIDHGYEAVSIDEIIRSVGGSKSNIYKQFGSKEGLFCEIIEQMCENLLVSYRSLDVSTLPARDGLRVLGTMLMRIVIEQRHVAFHRLVLAVSARFPEQTRIWFEAGPESARKVIATFITARQELGEIRSGDAHQLATLFHDMIVSNQLYLALMGEEPDWVRIDREISEAIAVLLDGCLSREISESRA